ncbi:MAG: hypothetical protein ACREF4_03870 [Gammaproteobacteria bacterium]
MTGAVLGAIGRAVVAGVHLRALNEGTALGLLGAVVIGVVIGGLAGLTARPLLGAVVGGVLSALAHLATLPIVALFHVLGVLTTPSIWEVVAVGALSGALGGVARRMATRHESNGKPRTRPR